MAKSRSQVILLAITSNGVLLVQRTIKTKYLSSRINNKLDPNHKKIYRMQQAKNSFT